MTSLTGHFDGKVIIPDGPVDLPLDQKLRIQMEPVAQEFPNGILGEDMVELIRGLGFRREDVEEMERAIEEGCERVDADGW